MLILKRVQLMEGHRMDIYWTIIAMIGAIAVGRALAADVVPVVVVADTAVWSVSIVVALCVGIAGIVAAFGTAAVRVIRALNEGNVLARETKRIVVAGQVAAVAANVVSAEKQQEIHLLVNNNLLTTMRRNLVLMKREFERTKKDSDREAYELAETELRSAEASALVVARFQVTNTQDNRTVAARAELEAGQARAGEAPDPHAQWVLSLEHVVALTKASAERTNLPADLSDYKLAQDNLASARKLA